MDKLTGREKDFYIDQMTRREGRLSDEVDEEYEKEHYNLEKQFEEQKLCIEEEEFIMADEEIVDNDTNNSDSEFMNSTIIDGSFTSNNVSLNRSGHPRNQNVGTDVSIQTYFVMPDRPKLRIKLRSCTYEIKNACAKLTSVCGLSVELSRKIVQIVCKELYQHDVYLSPSEQLLGEEGIATNDTNEKGHIPVLKKDLKNYTYVIPSSHTIADYKQIRASEMETMAAKALYKKEDEVKSFVHFDTTSRSSIDGDWPFIILRTSNGEEFRLRLFLHLKIKIKSLIFLLKSLNVSALQLVSLKISLINHLIFGKKLML